MELEVRDCLFHLKIHANQTSCPYHTIPPSQATHPSKDSSPSKRDRLAIGPGRAFNNDAWLSLSPGEGNEESFDLLVRVFELPVKMF